MTLPARIGTIGWLVLIACWASAAHAQTVSLAWDPDPDPTVAGYRLYYGTASGVYTQTMEIGNATAATVPNLAPGQTYFFAVTAYTPAAAESVPSNEVSYTVAGAAATPTPATGTGAQLMMAPLPAAALPSATAQTSTARQPARTQTPTNKTTWRFNYMTGAARRAVPANGARQNTANIIATPNGANVQAAAYAAWCDGQPLTPPKQNPESGQ